MSLLEPPNDALVVGIQATPSRLQGAKLVAAYVRRPLQSTSHHPPAPGPHLDLGAEEMDLGVSECDLFQPPRSSHFFLQ